MSGPSPAFVAMLAGSKPASGQQAKKEEKPDDSVDLDRLADLLEEAEKAPNRQAKARAFRAAIRMAREK